MTSDKCILCIEFSLNNTQTKTLTMGLNTGTMLPVFTLSGTWGSKVHLTDEEILTLIDEFFTPAQEHSLRRTLSWS